MTDLLLDALGRIVVADLGSDDARPETTASFTATAEISEELQKSLESEDMNTRLEAVKQITDNETLIKMASTDPTNEVRLEAFSRISDEEWLKTEIIAETGNPTQIRVSAVERITDISYLRELAGKDPDPGVVEAALKIIGDPDLIKELALTDKYPLPSRSGAMKQIKDEEILKKVVMETAQSGQDELGLAALDKITDEQFIKEVAVTSKAYKISVRAFEKITDQSWLREKALEGWVGAVKKIDDDDFLKQLYQDKNTDESARHAAFENIKDKAFKAQFTERSYDKPEYLDTTDMDTFRPTEDRVPAHKQQLLRLLLTVATPA